MTAARLPGRWPTDGLGVCRPGLGRRTDGKRKTIDIVSLKNQQFTCRLGEVCVCVCEVVPGSFLSTFHLCVQ